MKVFIRKLLILAIIASTITLVVNYMYVKQHKSDWDKFASVPDTLHICNFGSSHGMFGFNYEDIESEYNCFNFSLQGQHLSYDYRLFQHYNDHITEGTVVFVPVSYSFLFGIEDTSRDDFLSRNQRYYQILPPSLIKEWDRQTDIYFRYLPALVADTGDLVITLLGKSEVSLNEKVWRAVTTDIDAYRDAEHIIDKWFDEHDGPGSETQEEIDALYALIEGCQEKGAIPILISTPFLHEFIDAMKERENLFDPFYSLINQVVQDTGVEYYDYAFDERFINAYSWFTDSQHLNKEGARNFTNILMEEIVYAKGYLDK